MPWVGLQLVMAAIVILWPGLVTMWLDETKKIDLDKVRIDIPPLEFSPPDPGQLLQPGPAESAPPQSGPESIAPDKARESGAAERP